MRALRSFWAGADVAMLRICHGRTELCCVALWKERKGQMVRATFLSNAHTFFFCKLEFLNLGLANPGMELYNFITRIQNGF